MFVTSIWFYLCDRQLSVPGRVLQWCRAVVQPPVDVCALLVHLKQLRHVLDIPVCAGVDQLLSQTRVKTVIFVVLVGIAAILVLVPGLFKCWFVLFLALS